MLQPIFPVQVSLQELLNSRFKLYNFRKSTKAFRRSNFGDRQTFFISESDISQTAGYNAENYSKIRYEFDEAVEIVPQKH